MGAFFLFCTRVVQKGTTNRPIFKKENRPAVAMPKFAIYSCQKVDIMLKYICKDLCSSSILPRNNNSVVFILHHEAHLLQLLPMGLAGLHGIDPGRIQAGVPQNIRQPDDILLQGVIGPGEQVPQVVREHLSLRHAGLPAQRFHLMPDIASVQRPDRKSVV